MIKNIRYNHNLTLSGAGYRNTQFGDFFHLRNNFFLTFSIFENFPILDPFWPKTAWKRHQNERIDEFYINDEYINGSDVYILSRRQSKPKNITKNGTKWSKHQKVPKFTKNQHYFDSHIPRNGSTYMNNISKWSYGNALSDSEAYESIWGNFLPTFQHFFEKNSRLWNIFVRKFREARMYSKKVGKNVARGGP